MLLLQDWHASPLQLSQEPACGPSLSSIAVARSRTCPPTCYAPAPPRPKLHGHYFKQADRLAPFTPVTNSLSSFPECLSPLHPLHTYTMAGRALPSHLKPSAAEGGEGGFAPRHHGKTQSHVVGLSPFLSLSSVSHLAGICLAYYETAFSDWSVTVSALTAIGLAQPVQQLPVRQCRSCWA